MTIWRDNLAAQTDGDIRGQYASGYEKVVEPNGMAEYWNRPTYTPEDRRIMEAKMSHAQAYREARMAEKMRQREEAQAYFDQRKAGPLSLRTDIRMGSREAAANYAKAEADQTRGPASMYWARSDDGMDGHAIDSIMEDDFRWTDAGRR